MGARYIKECYHNELYQFVKQLNMFDNELYEIVIQLIAKQQRVVLKCNNTHCGTVSKSI